MLKEAATQSVEGRIASKVFNEYFSFDWDGTALPEEKEVNSDNLGIYLNKIMEESNEDKILVMTKLFSMIESFYESMDRENLDIEEVENYFQNITEQFADYSLINTEYFIDIIQDKDIDMNCDFKIKIED